MSRLAESEVDPLRHSPVLPEIVASLQQLLTEEQTKRQRFYAEMTPEQKTEFIEGEVIMHSPARNAHLIATRNLFFMLGSHVRERSLGQVFVEKCLCVFPRNDYEPDIVYFGPEKVRAFTPGTMRFPPPDFIVEVLSESTAANDRGVKFEDYAAHGVAEYWIVDLDKAVLEQYLATPDGRYEPAAKMSNGRVTSAVIPGFALEVAGIFTES